MFVNKQSVLAIFTSLKTTFNNAFLTTPTTWDKVAMKVTSTTGQNDYSWMSRFPKMRKWVGDKFVKNLEAYKYSVVNDDFEATIEVDRNDIEDDQLGMLTNQAEMAGWSAKQLPDEIVSGLLNGAFANRCFDGQYFIDTSHPVAGATVSNKGATALSCATFALAQGSYGAARTAMQLFKDDDGRPLGISPNLLVVGPALGDIGLALLNNDRLDDGKANPYKGTAELLVDLRLTSSTAWFLMDTTKPIKPLIYQERKAPVFVSQTDMASDDVFERKKFKFGAEARAAGGYAFWQLAFGTP